MKTNSMVVVAKYSLTVLPMKEISKKVSTMASEYSKAKAVTSTLASSRMVKRKEKAKRLITG